MTGIEVTGLLLGALPILFEAVDIYKCELQKGKVLFGERLVIKKLALALLLQQRTIAETVKLILEKSGCEQVALLDTDPVPCLDNAEVKRQVLDYLGPKHTIVPYKDFSYSNFTDTSIEVIELLH